MSLIKILSNSKGAMFGMDARLAMAIFAVLSLTAGYFSYGKLDKTKQVALIKEIAAISEGLANYQADVGTFTMFTIDGGSDGAKDIELLWDSSNVVAGLRPRWNGPYITRRDRNHKAYGTFTLSYWQANRTTACDSANECYAWLTLTNVPAEVWVKLNAYIDESFGGNTETLNNEHNEGIVQANGVADPRTLYYRSVKRYRN